MEDDDGGGRGSEIMAPDEGLLDEGSTNKSKKRTAVSEKKIGNDENGCKSMVGKPLTVSSTKSKGRKRVNINVDDDMDHEYTPATAAASSKTSGGAQTNSRKRTRVVDEDLRSTSNLNSAVEQVDGEPSSASGESLAEPNEIGLDHWLENLRSDIMAKESNIQNAVAEAVLSMSSEEIDELAERGNDLERNSKAGADTQRIESHWGHVKTEILRKMKGTSLNLLSGHLAEYWWRKIHKNTPFTDIINEIARQFPLL